MNRFVIWLALLPTLCLGQTKYTERELWQGLPQNQLPLGQVELVAKYVLPKMAGIAVREYREPHLVAVGMKNIGTNMIEEVEIWYMFHYGQMLLQPPTNAVLTHRVLPGGFRGRKTWSAIAPGEETFFPAQPLWDWFPVIADSPDGVHAFWWEVGTNRSNRLMLRKDGREIALTK